MGFDEDVQIRGKSGLQNKVPLKKISKNSPIGRSKNMPTSEKP